MPQYDPLRDGHPKESAMAQQRRTETTPFARIRAGLEESVAFARGEKTGAVVHTRCTHCGKLYADCLCMEPAP
jgi:hypothetical protein